MIQDPFCVFYYTTSLVFLIFYIGDGNSCDFIYVFYLLTDHYVRPYVIHGLLSVSIPHRDRKPYRQGSRIHPVRSTEPLPVKTRPELPFYQPNTLSYLNRSL